MSIPHSSFLMKAASDMVFRTFSMSAFAFKWFHQSISPTSHSITSTLSPVRLEINSPSDGINLRIVLRELQSVFPPDSFVSASRSIRARRISDRACSLQDENEWTPRRLFLRSSFASSRILLALKNLPFMIFHKAWMNYTIIPKLCYFLFGFGIFIGLVGPRSLSAVVAG